MSLVIPEYPLFDGAAKVSCVSTIPLIELEKNKSLYILSADCVLNHNNEFVDKIIVRSESEEPHLDPWGLALKLLKSELEKRGIAIEGGKKK